MDEEKKTYSSRCLLVHFSFSISSDCCWFLQNRLKGGRGRKREIKREKKEKKINNRYAAGKQVNSLATRQRDLLKDTRHSAH